MNCTPIQDVAMMPAESYEMLEEIRSKLREEYFPSGVSEEQLVNRLAVLFSERQRLDQYHAFKVEMRHAELRRRVPQAQVLQKTKSRARAIEETNDSREVEWFLSMREGTTEGKLPPRIGEFADGEISHDDILKIPDEPVHGREIFIKLAEEFPILERIKQREQLDVVIDRTIKRLMQLKTMKQMCRQLEPKVISSAKAGSNTPPLIPSVANVK